MHGQFRFSFPTNPLQEDFVLPNIVVQEGEDSFLKMIFQNNDTIIAGGANFYLGLCNQIPAQLDSLASITTEPGLVGGYARKPITRDAVGWPTIDVVNDRKRIISKQVTFVAGGTAFDTAFSRAFICNILTGSVGILFAYSAALDAAVTLLPGQTFDLQYEFFVD